MVKVMFICLFLPDTYLRQHKPINAMYCGTLLNLYVYVRSCNSFTPTLSIFCTHIYPYFNTHAYVLNCHSTHSINFLIQLIMKAIDIELSPASQSSPFCLLRLALVNT